MTKVRPVIDQAFATTVGLFIQKSVLKRTKKDPQTEILPKADAQSFNAPFQKKFLHQVVSVSGAIMLRLFTKSYQTF